MKRFMTAMIFVTLPVAVQAEGLSHRVHAAAGAVEPETERGTASLIADLYNMTSSRDTDVALELQRQMSAVLANKKQVDENTAYSLFSEELPEVEVDRIAISDAKRHLSVPSISQVKAGVAEELVKNPKDEFLRDWRLIRSGDSWFVGRPEEPQSYIDVRSGMILGAYGRVLSIWDSQDDFYLTLESGDRIRGGPAL